MYTFQTYPDLAKATIDERLRRAPQPCHLTALPANLTRALLWQYPHDG